MQPSRFYFIFLKFFQNFLFSKNKSENVWQIFIFWSEVEYYRKVGLKQLLMDTAPTSVESESPDIGNFFGFKNTGKKKKQTKCLL